MSNRLLRHRGVKIIPPAGTRKGPVDTTGYPYKLEVKMSRPEEARSFLRISLGHNQEYEVVAYGKSAKALLGFIQQNNLTEHDRFEKYIISDRKGNVISTFMR